MMMKSIGQDYEEDRMRKRILNTLGTRLWSAIEQIRAGDIIKQDDSKGN